MIVKADSIDALMQFFKNCTSQTQVNLATLIIQVQKGISVSSVDHEINIKKLALFDKLQEELLKLGIDILDEKDKDNIKILKGKETFVSECTSKLFIGGFYNYARENLDNPLSALKVSVTGFFRLDKERTLDLIRGILNNPEYVFLKTEIATNVVSNSNNNTAINIPMPPRTSIPPPPKLPQSEKRKRANTTATGGLGDISKVQLKKVELPVDDKKDEETKGDVANIAKLAIEQKKKLRSSVILPETIVDDSIKIEDNTATALSIEEKIKHNKQQTGSTPVGENSSNLWRTSLRKTGSTLISSEVSNQTNTNNPPPPNMPSMGNNNNNN